MKTAYLVRWQAPAMAAPAFWYFATEASANDAANDLRSRGRSAIVERTTVSDDFELDE